MIESCNSGGEGEVQEVKLKRVCRIDVRSLVLLKLMSYVSVFIVCDDVVNL